MKSRHTSDQDLVLAVERAKRRNRSSASRRDGWERELWSAYLLDGPARMRAANGPPIESA